MSPINPSGYVLREIRFSQNYKLLNLYLLVSLRASLPRTDYAKLPCLPRGKRPALAFF